VEATRRARERKWYTKEGQVVDREKAEQIISFSKRKSSLIAFYPEKAPAKDKTY